ncbi:MAG TPA: hypothetical protein VJL59_19360 [Anaerolineales bacterium]|nr:hypothetical protein [Anaerolineales bacterium]
MRDLKNSPQVVDLIADFDIYVQVFDRLKPFSESKVKTHLETIKMVRSAPKFTDVLDNDAWFEKLMATLVEWGMDRTYTIAFFYGRPESLQASTQQTKFIDMWAAFHRVATKAISAIQSHVGQGMHTGVPKVIDNAIVGYIKAPKLAKLDV